MNTSTASGVTVYKRKRLQILPAMQWAMYCAYKNATTNGPTIADIDGDHKYCLLYGGLSTDCFG
jgi:hypothetical protein